MSEEKPGQIESAVQGIASALPFAGFKELITSYFRPAAAIKATKASLGAAANNLAGIGFLVGVATGIAAIIGQALFGTTESGMMGSLAGFGFGTGIVGLVVMAILGPIIYVISVFVGSALYFVAAKLLGGKGSFTLQTHAFALVMCGTALLALPFQFFGFIPVIGAMLGIAIALIELYSLYSYYRAIKEVHQLSQMRAIAILLLPIILAFVVLVVLFGLAFLTLAGASSSLASAPY